MFRLTVLLIATLSTVRTVDFTVGAEFETTKLKALGQYYHDNPLVESDTYIIHTDMGGKFFTLESATKGPIDPRNFKDVFVKMQEHLEDFLDELKENAARARIIFTEENVDKKLDDLNYELEKFDPFDANSTLQIPTGIDQLIDIYQRFDKIQNFWKKSVNIGNLDFDFEECTFVNMAQNMENMEKQVESKKAFNDCVVKLDDIHQYLNRRLDMLDDFVWVYQTGFDSYDPNDFVDDNNKSAPSLLDLIQRGHIAWMNNPIRKIGKKDKRALIRYFCKDCENDFGIIKESADTVKAVAHHTIGLKLAKVPQLFQYYQSYTFNSNFIGLKKNKEIGTIIGKMNGGMFINEQRFLNESHRKRIKAILINLGMDIENKISTMWNEEVLTQYLNKTKDDSTINQCDKGQDAVGLNLLFLSYAINMFIGDTTDDELTEKQLKKYKYGPKKALRLMSRVSFRKLYLDLENCQPIFKNFFDTLCQNNACDQLRLVAFHDGYGYMQNKKPRYKLEKFKGEDDQITLRQWYNSIINGINVQKASSLNNLSTVEETKQEMCSLKRNPPQTSTNFDAFFDCEQTDLLSPTKPASNFVTKQALEQYFGELLSTENPIKFQTLKSYMSRFHAPMGGYRDVEKGWIILENRAVAKGVPFSTSGDFADTHFKCIRKHVINQDHFEEVYSDDDQEVYNCEDESENSAYPWKIAKDVKEKADRLVI